LIRSLADRELRGRELLLGFEHLFDEFRGIDIGKLCEGKHIERNSLSGRTLMNETADFFGSLA
jgi:hypothetical protein